MTDIKCLLVEVSAQLKEEQSHKRNIREVNNLLCNVVPVLFVSVTGDESWEDDDEEEDVEQKTKLLLDQLFYTLPMAM